MKKGKLVINLIENATDEITIVAIIFLGAIAPINYYITRLNRPPGIYLHIDPTPSFIFLFLILVLLLIVRLLILKEEKLKSYMKKVTFALIALVFLDIPMFFISFEQYFYYIIILVAIVFSISFLIQIPELYKKYGEKKEKVVENKKDR